MRSSFWRCRFVVAVVTIFLGLILACPGSAQAGFFDDIFGQLFRPPSYRDDGPWRPEPGFRRRGNNWSYRRSHKSASHSAHKKVIVAARTNQAVQAQEPVDIMEDDSLRKGDVVMTKAGIRVFIGYSGDHHDPEDFRKPSEVKGLSKNERKALAALDTQTSASGVTSGIVTGRSATEGGIAAGEMITDAKGRAIRFVGP